MNDKMRIRIMFWNPSVHGTNNNDSESVKYINMLGTAMENENKEEFRSIVSSLTGIFAFKPFTYRMEL